MTGISDYPYTPPPIDPAAEATPTGPVPAPSSGVHTSFNILYNWHTGCFQIGNAAFEHSPEGLRNLAQYLIHYTPQPGKAEAPKPPLPRPHEKDKVFLVRPVRPKHLRQMSRAEARDALEALDLDDLFKDLDL